VLEEQRLDTAIHDCVGFDCGVPALNDYLRKFASQHRRRSVSQTFVLVDDSAPTQVLGYYTLSAAQRSRKPGHSAMRNANGCLAIRSHVSEWGASRSAWRAAARGTGDC
jgi:hypothetical protein